MFIKISGIFMSFFKKKDFNLVKEVSKTSGLSKNLGPVDLILFGLGAVIGTGVFALTGLVAAQYAGPAVMLSYLIAGVTCIFVALTYTELATMLPTSGSIYTYSYVVFGEGIAWIVGSVLALEMTFAAAAVASSWSAYIQGLLEVGGIVLPRYLAVSPSEGGLINLPAILIIGFVGVVLFMGTKESKKLNTILVILKMIAIFAFIIAAVPHFDPVKYWVDFMPFGFDDVLYGASILFFAFTGFGILASTAEECKNPKRDVTIGIIGSLLIASILYAIVAGLLTGIISYEKLNNSQPLAIALKYNNSNIGSAIVATGAICGMTTVIMMNIYALSRIFYVMARDGLLPKAMSKLHPKYDTPYITLMFFGAASALLSALLPLNLLGKLSSMGALMDYIAVILCVVAFRFIQPHAERSFRCPALFVIAPIALIASVFLLFKLILKNGKLLDTGEMVIYWFIIVFSLYIIKIIFFNKNRSL